MVTLIDSYYDDPSLKSIVFFIKMLFEKNENKLNGWPLKNLKFISKINLWGVVVAQLAERLIPTSRFCRLNPVIDKLYITYIQSTVLYRRK